MTSTSIKDEDFWVMWGVSRCHEAYTLRELGVLRSLKRRGLVTGDPPRLCPHARSQLNRWEARMKLEGKIPESSSEKC